SAIAGVGVYNGDRVQIICGAGGDPVGPSGNTAWSYVANLSRPTIGNGWVSEHSINDGAAPNQWPAGVGACGADVPGAGAGPPPPVPGPGTPPRSGAGGATPSPSSPPPGGSLYYSPYGSEAGGKVKDGKNWLGKDRWTYAPSPADVTLNSEDWDKNRDRKGC